MLRYRAFCLFVENVSNRYQKKFSSILPLIFSLPFKDRTLLYARNQMYSPLNLCPFPFSYSFLHPQTYAPRNVGHKVISSVFHPYDLTKCRLPLLYPRG